MKRKLIDFVKGFATKNNALVSNQNQNARINNSITWLSRKLYSFEFLAKGVLEHSYQSNKFKFREYVRERIDTLKHKVLVSCIIKCVELLLAYELGHLLSFLIFSMLFQHWKKVIIKKNKKLIPSNKFNNR